MFSFTKHALNVIREKGFSAEDVHEALTNPYKITPVTRHPGQKRYCGAGLAVVVADNVVITVYLDGVVTPMREDQKNDFAAINSVRLNGGSING